MRSSEGRAVVSSRLGMKLLWMTDDFLPHYGGSRQVYYHLIRHFPPGEVAVLTKRRPGSAEFDARERFRITRGLFLKLPGRPPVSELPVYAEMLFRGAWLLARERRDLIVCGEIYPTAVVGRVLAAANRTPYLVYLHGEEMSVLRNLRTGRRVMRSVLRAAGAVVAASTPAYEAAREEGVDPERIHKITPGVDDYFFEAIPSPRRIRERYRLEGKRLLLTVGRLVRRKGHAAVIGVLPELLREFPDVAYLVVGTGPEEERLRHLAGDMRVSGAVVFAGRLPREDLVDCYAACDIFVQPNRELEDGDTEGGGIVFLEAAALGKPVIAGRAGGTGDSVVDGETGFRVDAAAPGELLGTLRRILRDPSLAARLGERARRLATTGRRWQDRADALRGLCLGLSGGWGARPTGPCAPGGRR